MRKPMCGFEGGAAHKIEVDIWFIYPRIMYNIWRHYLSLQEFIFMFAMLISKE
jgi:hypothetical protein